MADSNRVLVVGGVRYEVPPADEPIVLYSTDGSTVLVKINGNGITTPSGEIVNSVVQAAGLSSNLKKGFLPLPLGQWRIVATNDVPAIAVASGNGGQLASDTAPKLARINGATDKGLRIQWAASGVVEIMQDFVYPPDLDDTAAVVVNILASMAATTDTPTMAVGYFEGLGDTNAGGNTAAITGTTITQYTVTIAAADVGAYPNKASIQLTPGAHGTDALNLYAAWIEYTRKS